MTVKAEISTADVETALAGIEQQLKQPARLFGLINEYMLKSTRQRFKDQKDPQGQPWQKLSSRYLKRKHRNKEKILTLRGYLQGTLSGTFNDSGLAFGTNNVYGGIHNAGGVIKHKARQQTLNFRQAKDGTVGNRFVKRKKANFTKEVSVGPYEVTIPKRQWLGLSASDHSAIAKIAIRWLNRQNSPNAL